MARPWMDLPRSTGGATQPNMVAPFGNYARISYHSVNSAICPYHSINSAIFAYPVEAFSF